MVDLGKSTKSSPCRLVPPCRRYNDVEGVRLHLSETNFNILYHKYSKKNTIIGGSQCYSFVWVTLYWILKTLITAINSTLYLIKLGNLMLVFLSKVSVSISYTYSLVIICWCRHTNELGWQQCLASDHNATWSKKMYNANNGRTDHLRNLKQHDEDLHVVYITAGFNKQKVSKVSLMKSVLNQKFYDE